MTDNPDGLILPDLCSNCGQPLTDEWPDRHEHGLRRCRGLTSQHGDVYASRGYPKVETANERIRKRNVARQQARSENTAEQETT